MLYIVIQDSAVFDWKRFRCSLLSTRFTQEDYRWRTASYFHFLFKKNLQLLCK